MRRRIIINIDENTEDGEAVDHVRRVIDQGLISNGGKQYCYVTTFRDGKIVYAGKTRKGNSVFVVGDNPSR